MTKSNTGTSKRNLRKTENRHYQSKPNQRKRSKRFNQNLDSVLKNKHRKISNEENVRYCISQVRKGESLDKVDRVSFVLLVVLLVVVILPRILYLCGKVCLWLRS